VTACGIHFYAHTSWNQKFGKMAKSVIHRLLVQCGMVVVQQNRSVDLQTKNKKEQQ
jgi:hypothetical protein